VKKTLQDTSTCERRETKSSIGQLSNGCEPNLSTMVLTTAADLCGVSSTLNCLVV